MEKDLVYKIYMINLETGNVTETHKEFYYDVEARLECELLNESQIIGDNIKYFFYFTIFNCFMPFKSQKQLKEDALKELKRFNERINGLKAMSLVATKSLLQGGLNKKEAV